MKEGNGKITLPKELQREMMKFFLETSIPRIKKEKELLSTDKQEAGSNENEE